MERIKALNRYQKAVLLVIAVMLTVFTVLYPLVFSRLGYEYADHILIPAEEKGSTVYTGRIRGTDTVITVTDAPSVEIRYGSKVYGPYTAMKDPTAVPRESELADYMTGVEIREGKNIFFRGGVMQTGEDLVLFDEDGSYANIYVSYSQGNGTVLDLNGNVVDEMEPSASAILELMEGPSLTRRGEWAAWLCGAVLCICTAVSIAYADELFRWQISFRVSNPESAEPSEHELAGRYISWTVLPLLALAVFILGLYM